MSTEVATSSSVRPDGATYACTNEPPHRFEIRGRARAAGGIRVSLQRIDASYPVREVFVTGREMKMGYENVYKACFVCVDRGIKETAIPLPKSDVELAP